MNPSNRSSIPLLALTLATSFFAGVTAVVAHEPPGGKQTEAKLPATYGEAVAAIAGRSAAIRKLIADGKLGGIHAEAEAMKWVADTMPKLVAKPESGVPETAYKEVLQASKSLSAMFPKLDEAGDSGNLAASQKLHAEVVPLVAVLQKYAVPAARMFACPMHPEQTAKAEGACSVCGMNLVETEVAAPDHPEGAGDHEHAAGDPQHGEHKH